jgi:hypothetical protein
MHKSQCILQGAKYIDVNTISTADFFGKYLYFATLARCLPGKCDISTICLLCHLTNHMILSVHTCHLFACYVYMGHEKVIRNLTLVSMQTWAIPSMFATFTNSLWEMDKWPIFVQVHPSYTAIFIHK